MLISKQRRVEDLCLRCAEKIPSLISVIGWMSCELLVIRYWLKIQYHAPLLKRNQPAASDMRFKDTLNPHRRETPQLLRLRLKIWMMDLAMMVTYHHMSHSIQKPEGGIILACFERAGSHWLLLYVVMSLPYFAFHTGFLKDQCLTACIQM